MSKLSPKSRHRLPEQAYAKIAPRQRARLRRLRLIGTAALPFAILVLFWQIIVAANLFPPEMVQGPIDVSRSLVTLVTNGELVAAMTSSFYRLAVGFGGGAVAGLAVGVLVASSRWAGRIIEPVFHVLRQIPVIAFTPMLILMVGVGDGFKITAVAISTMFTLALATRDAVLLIADRYREVAELFRLPFASRLRFLILPAILPGVLTGARIALTRAWMVLVMSELISGDSGIGQLMEIGRQTFRMDVVMVGIIATGTVGFLLDRGMQNVQVHLSRWRAA